MTFQHPVVSLKYNCCEIHKNDYQLLLDWVSYSLIDLQISFLQIATQPAPLDGNARKAVII